MKRKTIFIISAVALLLIVLIIGKKAGWFGGNSDVLTVETEKITPTTIVQKVSATGKIQPELEIKLSSEVSGEIIELPVKEEQRSGVPAPASGCPLGASGASAEEDHPEYAANGLRPHAVRYYPGTRNRLRGGSHRYWRGYGYL